MSELLFDLEALHKKQNHQRWLKLSVGSIVLVIVAVIGVILISSKHTPTEHIATVGDSGAISPSNTDTTQQPTSTNNLSQQIAQEEAQAAKDEAAAGQDITNAENMQSDLNNETTPATIPSNSPATSTPNPALCPGIEAQEQSAVAPYSAQAKQLNSELQSLDNSNSLENPQTAATLQTISNELNSVDGQIGSIDAQYAPQLAANECS